jgi:hypothetical protein
LLDLLRLSISSRLSDKDDFKQIILKSESSEINIYREDDDFATQLNGKKLVIQESDLVDKIDLDQYSVSAILEICALRCLQEKTKNRR